MLFFMAGSSEAPHGLAANAGPIEPPSPLRDMFPADMAESSRKSAAFFVGLLGGPPLYHQRYGPPMMRAPHMNFPIDERARRVWLACFRGVLDGAPADFAFPEAHIEGLWAFLEGFSGWMVNRASPGGDGGDGDAVQGKMPRSE